MAAISLIITRGGQGYDISNLVESISWKGRKNAAARSITATLIDDDGHAHARSEIDVERGDHCLFSYNGAELFRGMITTQNQTHGKKLVFTAYDLGISLKNNEDTFCYDGKTASEIFVDCCKRFGLPYSDVAQTAYRMPELTKPKTTAFDVVADALSQEFDATGIRHYVIAQKGYLKLLTRRENILQWVIETGQNLISYNYTRSIEKIKTRIKMVSKEGTTVAEKNNAALESKIGIFQGIEKPDESLSDAQLRQLVASILEEKSAPEKSLDIEAVGIPDVVSGIGVMIIIKPLGLSQTFYVDEDTHTFQDRKHTMKLKLNFASDLTRTAPQQAAADTDYKVGDIVNFKGGYHYVSSVASSPTGGNRKGGLAKLTLIAKSAKHPYHLIGGAYTNVDGNCNVYGWVDAGTFSK